MKKLRDFLMGNMGILSILLIWQIISMAGFVPIFMLPSPKMVWDQLSGGFIDMLPHLGFTMAEAVGGLLISALLGVGSAIVMDRFLPVRRFLHPLLVLTQTIPVVAIAPLLVLWFGFGILPKLLLIVLVCYFPLAVAVLSGFDAADRDMINLLKAMGASENKTLSLVKWPQALPQFFAGLKIAASYGIVGAVIAEWLGGDMGLGVLMTRARKSYAYDKMFAIIIVVSVVSLLLVFFIGRMEKASMPWRQKGEQ